MSGEDGSAMGFYPGCGFQNQSPSCLLMGMLSSLLRYGRTVVQGVRYLTGDQQIWSSNRSYHLPSKICEYLSGMLERAHGILISVRH